MSVADEVADALRLSASWQAEVRSCWLRLIDIATWGNLKSQNLGSLSKVRKRLLEVGEKLRSLFNDRGWIPQAREQLKNALGSSLNLHDSLLALEKAAKDIEGGEDYVEFETLLVELHKNVVGPLREKENAWAELLDRLNRERLEDEETP
jgi:hypothetical protein